MFDIIRCKADASEHGFDRFFIAGDLKGRIIDAENLEAATKHRNKKVLIRLKDHAFDEGAIKLIAEKKKACFLIDLSKIITSKGVYRAIAMSKLRTFLQMCARHGAFYTFASFAENEKQIRSPDELMHIIMLFGLNKGQAKFSLKMLQHYCS